MVKRTQVPGSQKAASSADPAADLAAIVLDTIPSALRWIRRELREAAREELSVPQLRVLSHMHRKGSVTSAEISELQGVSLAAVSKMVDVMAERGLLERSFRDGNRKQIHLRMTDRGRVLYLRSKKATQREIASALAGADPRQRRAIREGLLALRDLLRLDVPRQEPGE